MGKQGSEVVRTYLYQYVTDLMTSHLNRQIGQTRQLAVPGEVLVHYVVSSFLALLTWWLDHRMLHGADRMEEIFTTLTAPGIKTALGSVE
jgi:hypothetical protein